MLVTVRGRISINVVAIDGYCRWIIISRGRCCVKSRCVVCVSCMKTKSSRVSQARASTILLYHASWTTVYNVRWPTRNVGDQRYRLAKRSLSSLCTVRVSFRTIRFVDPEFSQCSFVPNDRPRIFLGIRFLRTRQEIFSFALRQERLNNFYGLFSKRKDTRSEAFTATLQDTIARNRWLIT